MTAQAGLVILTLAFAALVGLNDGSVLVVTGPIERASQLVARLAVLSAAVVVVPLLGMTTVATTLAERLNPAEGGGSLSVVVCGVVAASCVAVVLHRLGRPTSLSLALIGGLTGAALAVTGRVAWGVLGLTIGLGAAAPVVAAAAGWVAGRAPVLLDQRVRAARVAGPLGPVSFGALSFAYAMNDGQKAIVVPMVAAGTAGMAVAPGWRWLLAAGGAFALGAWAGRHRANRSVLAGVVPARARHASAARLSSAAVSIGGASVGAPLSITQAMAGSLAGSAAGEGIGRVRWGAARSIAAAWALTLPAGFGAGAALAGTARWLG